MEVRSGGGGGGSAAGSSSDYSGLRHAHGSSAWIESAYLRVSDWMDAQRRAEAAAALREEKLHEKLRESAEQAVSSSGSEKRRRKRRKAGYTDKGRIAYRREHGALATGSARSCLPDAVWNVASDPSVRAEHSHPGDARHFSHPRGLVRWCRRHTSFDARGGPSASEAKARRRHAGV